MYRNSFRRSYDPWAEFWGLDSLLGQTHETSHSLPVSTAWKDDEKAVVELELPGIEPADVGISVEGHKLTITGKRDALSTGDKERIEHSERWHGEFTKTYDLPYEIDSGSVVATYQLGVLTVTLPRAEADKPHKIDITLN